MYDTPMSSKPTSISDLIGRWPTIGEFAAAIGCGYEAARQMRKRQSIAPEHWHNVVSASKRKGVTGVSLEWLSAQRSPSKETAGAA